MTFGVTNLVAPCVGDKTKEMTTDAGVVDWDELSGKSPVPAINHTCKLSFEREVPGLLVIYSRIKML